MPVVEPLSVDLRVNRHVHSRTLQGDDRNVGCVRCLDGHRHRGGPEPPALYSVSCHLGTIHPSSEPFPVCLRACYWARLHGLVFGVTSYDVANYGFEDLQLYREMAYEAGSRSLRGDAVGAALREDARAALRSWADQLPGQVVPKL